MHGFEEENDLRARTSEKCLESRRGVERLPNQESLSHCHTKY